MGDQWINGNETSVLVDGNATVLTGLMRITAQDLQASLGDTLASKCGVVLTLIESFITGPLRYNIEDVPLRRLAPFILIWPLGVVEVMNISFRHFFSVLFSNFLILLSLLFDSQVRPLPFCTDALYPGQKSLFKQGA